MDKGRKGFILFYDSWNGLERLKDEQLGKFLRACYCHELGKELPDMDDTTQMAFSLVQNYLDSNRKSYEEKCRKNKENGAKGGRPRKDQKDPDSNKPNGFFENRSVLKGEKPNGFFENPNDTETENEKDTDTGTDTVTGSPPADMQTTALTDPDSEKPNGFGGDIFASIYNAASSNSSQYVDAVAEELPSEHGTSPWLALFDGVPVRGEIWKPTEDQLSELEAAFPSVNVKYELQKLRLFALQKPNMHLDTTNMPQAVENWMRRAEDQAERNEQNQRGSFRTFKELSDYAARIREKKD